MSLNHKRNRTISVIVPTYNEADSIEACLDALFSQPHVGEVIVVDNNSNDQTCAIAAAYDNVRILHESRQGQVFARHTGFCAAQLPILATVDADTIVRSDWSQALFDTFSDGRVAAASTYVGLYDEGAGIFDAWKDAIVNWYEYGLGHFIVGHPFLFGSSMAMRADVWNRVQSEVRLTQAIWEDLQYAILIHDQGLEIATIRKVHADISARRFRDFPAKHVAWYITGYIRTFRAYDRRGPLIRAYIGYPIKLPVVLGFRYIMRARRFMRRSVQLASKRLEQATRLR